MTIHGLLAVPRVRVLAILGTTLLVALMIGFRLRFEARGQQEAVMAVRHLFETGPGTMNGVTYKAMCGDFDFEAGDSRYCDPSLFGAGKEAPVRVSCPDTPAPTLWCDNWLCRVEFDQSEVWVDVKLSSRRISFQFSKATWGDGVETLGKSN